MLSLFGGFVYLIDKAGEPVHNGTRVLMEGYMKRGVLNICVGLFGQILIILLGIVIPRLFLVNFGSETNGFLNSVTQIFSYFTLFEAGIGTASLQALYGPVARQDRQGVSRILAAAARFYHRTGVCYLLAVVLLAVIYPLCVSSDIPRGTMAVVILFNGTGGALAYLFQGKFLVLLQAEGKNYILSFVSTAVNVASSLCKVVLIGAGCSLPVIQGSFLAINILQMLGYEIYIRKKYGWIDLMAEPDYQAIAQKNSVLVHQFSTLVFGNTDVILLTFFTDDLKLVSVYTVYNMITGMCRNLVEQISGGVAFRMGQLYQTDRKKYFVYHHYYEVMNLTLGFAVFTAAYLLLPPFVRLYTDGVEDIDYLMPYLPLFFVLVQLISTARQASARLIDYAGHFQKTQWRALLETGINLTVSIVGIWRFGIYGVLFGTIAALLYRANDMILYTYRHIIGGSPWKTYRRWGVNLVVFAAVCLVSADRSLFVESYPQFALRAVWVGAGTALLYVAVNALCEREMVKEMAGRFLPGR